MLLNHIAHAGSKSENIAVLKLDYSFNEQMKAGVFEFPPCDLRACDSIDQVDLQSFKIVAEAVLHLLKTLARQ